MLVRVTRRPLNSRRLLIGLNLLPALWGCGVSQDAHLKVVQERDSLRRELDEFQHGPSRLLETARTALGTQKYEEARDIGRQLIERHPTSTEAREVAAVI